MKSRLVLAAAAVCLLGASATYATPTTFFGQDQNPSSSTTNSDTAHTQFLSNLSSGVGTENFDSLSLGQTAPVSLSFPGSGPALTPTLNGNGSVVSGNNAGAYATSGSQYYLVITGNAGNEFNIDFSSSPISAFGFYGTDISDSGSAFNLTLTDTLGGMHNLAVTNDGNSNSGNQLFFGFVDNALSYTNISFKSTSGGDYFGFDDMTIGDLGQVTIGVPEPRGVAMFGLGLLGMLLIVRRRRYS